MALSVIVYPGDGVTSQFNIPFTLGYINEDEITCRVGTETDGTGAPIYRALTFLSPEVVVVSGDVPGNGVPVRFERTVDREQLIVDFEDGAIINEENMNTAQKQALMLVHEVLDGRFEQFQTDVDMAGFRFKNMGDPIDTQDAATKGYVDARIVSNQQYAAQAIDARDDAVAARDAAEVHRNAAYSWASAPEDVPVTDGTNSGYSAFHWAEKAKGYVDSGVVSVNGRGGEVVLTKSDVNLGSVDNTSDADKPVSTAQAAAIATKVSKTGDTMSGSLTTNGLVYTSATYVGNTDLNDLLAAGHYDGNQLTNVPYGAGDINVWWFVEVQRHSFGDSYTVQRAILLNKPGAAWWVRRRVADAWGRWGPESGVATPGHYGCPKSTTAPNIGSGAFNNTDFQAWLNHNGPIALDGWYRITTAVYASMATKQGFHLQGAGTTGGIVCTDAGRIVIQDIGVDNPWGASFDTAVIKDLTIIYSWNADSPLLTIVAAGGTSGSAVPTLHMDNVHIYPSGITAGVTADVGLFQFNNVRQAHIQNCGGAGLYNGYRGIMFNCIQNEGTAAVEVVFDNCRGAHFQKGWVLSRAQGAIANDDSQGWHWRGCAVLAVDRGWELDGGPEGFGEWACITECHAYFREVGILTTNYGNLRIKDGYFLAHGALATCQGIALTGTPSLEPWSVIKDNRIRLDAATGASKRSLNFSAGYSGVAQDNKPSGTTAANILGGVTDGGRNT